MLILIVFILYTSVPSLSSSVRLIYIEKCLLLYTIIFSLPRGGPKLDQSSEFRCLNRRGSVRYRTDSSENRTLVPKFGRDSVHIANHLLSTKNAGIDNSKLQ